jgi:hydroxyacyl-ACP dehydratase HTD2-like protein with hotdog domain
MDSADQFDEWLADWHPLPESGHDAMDPGPVRALSALFNQDPPASPVLPPLWHWLYFLQWPPTSDLGPDGHPLVGAALPPIPERTRMFVGGRLRHHAGLVTGQAATRHSEVVDRTVKQGRSGTMLFVTVRHQIEQQGKVAVVDEQDLMYRSGAVTRTASQPTDRPSVPPSSDAAWQQPFSAGPVTLFRFSALTANSHRIHYDHPYATGAEGYPDLVVHGPLLAMAMVGVAVTHEHSRPVATMAYRFLRPVFSGDPTLIIGRPSGDEAQLAVLGPDGQARAEADVTFS